MLVSSTSLICNIQNSDSSPIEHEFVCIWQAIEVITWVSSSPSNVIRALIGWVVSQGHLSIHIWGQITVNKVDSCSYVWLLHFTIPVLVCKCSIGTDSTAPVLRITAELFNTCKVTFRANYLNLGIKWVTKHWDIVRLLVWITGFKCHIVSLKSFLFGKSLIFLFVCDSLQMLLLILGWRFKIWKAGEWASRVVNLLAVCWIIDQVFSILVLETWSFVAKDQVLLDLFFLSITYKQAISGYTTAHWLLISTGVLLLNARGAHLDCSSKEFFLLTLNILLCLTKASKVVFRPVNSHLVLCGFIPNYRNVILWLIDHIAHRLVGNLIRIVNRIVKI